MLASRPKTYAARGTTDRNRPRFRGGPVNKRHQDQGGAGHEIVSEVVACDSCAQEAQANAAPPPVVETETPTPDEEV